MANDKELVKETEDLNTDDLEFKTESDEKEVEVKAEAEETDKDEVKAESEEEELKTEADEDKEEVKMEADKEEVKVEVDDEEVKAEEDCADPIVVKSEEEVEDDKVKTEVDEPAPSDDYKLSEELNDLLKVELDPTIKEKIDTAFDTIVKEQIARLKEQLRDDATKELKESVAKLRSSVKMYVEQAARSYINKNRLALKESLRLKYFESFFGKVKTLFKENFVELPESDEDVVADLKKENDELKSKTDELVKDNTKLAESVILLKRQSQIEKLASDMYLTESNRFKIATEKLLNESAKTSDKKFAEKLKMVAEMFSTKKTPTAKKKLLSEGKIPSTTAEKASNDKVHPDVAAIIDGF